MWDFKVWFSDRPKMSGRAVTWLDIYLAVPNDRIRDITRVWFKEHHFADGRERLLAMQEGR